MPEKRPKLAPIVISVRIGADGQIRRLPSVSRIHFIECAGNNGSEWGPFNEVLNLRRVRIVFHHRFLVR
jgi:hypothetical protein